MQSPSGGWIVVEAAPEPFPNPWQARLMLWFLACLAVLVPAGYVFARRLTAPLSAFAKAADRLGRDPGAAAIPLKGPAEIGVAASAFNQMQERLARYVKDRTAMIGAVAHDLRTPIARIQFKLQRLDPAAWNAIGSDLAQMEEMIAGVLAFVRDASHAPERAALDLRSVLECVADDAEAMGREVALAEGPSPVIDADAGAIRRLFDNLVGNAVTYGQRARIDLAVENGLAFVTIADDGPGLPQAEVERVFEPFFRTEASRNRDTGGIGLGLTVARSLARAHGGDVVLANAGQSVGGCGLIATVSLPLSRQ